MTLGPPAAAGASIKIAPSILAADFSRLGDEVSAAVQGGADAIHVDVMDGRFVPEITIGPLIVDTIRRVTALPIDVHLMIVEPERQLEACVRSGATSVIVHVEAVRYLHRIIEQAKELGLRAGVALNPATPAWQIEPVLSDVDLVLVMSVNPGYAGQRFIPAVLPKLRQVRGWIVERALAADLQVDGGVNVSTAPAAVSAGANVLVAASAIFGTADGVDTAVRLLREAARQPLPADGMR